MPSSRTVEPIAASLILNIAIRETLSSGDYKSRRFGSRSGPTNRLRAKKGPAPPP